MLDLAENNPGTNTIATHVRFSHKIVQLILFTYDIHPHRIKNIQLIDESEFVTPLRFSSWYLQMHVRDPCFPTTILFTNEETGDGISNSRNTECGRRRTHMQQEHVQHKNGFQSRYGSVSYQITWTGHTCCPTV